MKGVIFDLDGTLIDSMWIWDKVDRAVLAQYGKEPEADYEQIVNKLNFGQCIRYIRDTYNLPLTYEALDEMICEMAYKEYANINSLKPGAEQFICQLKKEGIKIGLATSCLRRMSEAVLKNCGIYHQFDAFVYSDEFGKNKSEPDIYLRTARLLGVDAEDIVVFEDMLSAAESAKNAGMAVVGIYDVQNDEQKKHLKKVCDHCIEHFCGYSIKKTLFF